jgi:hypothetical protein
MSWVRSNLRVGSWCALFALAVQLIVLFNHVHCGPTVCWPASQPLIGAIELGSADTSAQSKPSAPATGEYCIFCAVIHLAGNALPAVAPTPSTSSAYSVGRHWTDRSVVLTATPHQIFQARAPPLG